MPSIPISWVYSSQQTFWNWSSENVNWICIIELHFYSEKDVWRHFITSMSSLKRWHVYINSWTKWNIPYRQTWNMHAHLSFVDNTSISTPAVHLCCLNFLNGTHIQTDRHDWKLKIHWNKLRMANVEIVI